jgi:hypothetical protein
MKWEFSVFHSAQTDFGAHPDSYTMDTGGCFPEINRPEREADHSPAFNDEFKNNRSTLPLSHMFHVMILN